MIEKLVYGGDGLARVDGRVVFVPLSLPGEVWEDGRLVTASPDRIPGPCPFFGNCGGCQFQHMPYAMQLEQKRAILREQLERIGKLKDIPEIAVVAGEPWQYRNRTQLHFDGRKLGYHRLNSKDLCPVDHCPISSPVLNRAITALTEMAKDRSFPSFLESVELFTNETETLINVLGSAKPLRRQFFDWCAERIPGATLPALEYAVGGDVFRVSHKAFFQVNRFLIEDLVRLTTADGSGESAWDLYAGVGLFSVPLARSFARVTAVEVVGSAAHDLEFNLQKSGVRAGAVRSSTEDFLAAQTEAPDYVLADPPRAGLGKRVTESLLRLKPRSLAIVSCDPATLARDLSALIAGGYVIRNLTLVDLFPQTFHIETVAKLELSQ